MTEKTDKRLVVPKNPAMALRELNARHGAAPPQEADDDRPTATVALPGDPSASSETEAAVNNTTILPTNKQTDRPTSKPTNKQTDRPANRQTGSKAASPARPRGAEPPAPRRIDGRTLRARQETADRTMVTSMRLSVAVVEQLDEFCWSRRMRKQDVVQEALEMYFAAQADDEGEEEEGE